MAVKDTDWDEFGALLAETCIVAVKDPDTAAIRLECHRLTARVEGSDALSAQSDETVKTVTTEVGVANPRGYQR